MDCADRMVPSQKLLFSKPAVANGRSRKVAPCELVGEGRGWGRGGGGGGGAGHTEPKLLAKIRR
jgi:hypothetical protein